MKNRIFKMLFVGSLLTAPVSAAFAQATIGSVTFGTYNGANSLLGKVFLQDGLTGPGAGYLGQLWWSDGANGTFAPIGVPRAFDSFIPTAVFDGSVLVPGRSGGATVFIQMRVWNASAGSNWCIAIGNPPGSNPLLQGWVITGSKSRILGGADSEDNLFTPQQFNNFANTTMCPMCQIPNESFCTSGLTRPTLLCSNAGTGLVLSWSGPFVLQSATNATGVYSDILVSGVPHTERTTAVGQRFFRLRD